MNNTDKLRCLLLPTTDFKLVLPHNSVEEILPFAVVEASTSSKHYILGTLNWRRSEIPLVSFEVLNNKPSPELKRRTRAAVIQLLTADNTVRYFSIILSGMPKMVVVSAADLQEVDEAKRPSCTAKKVLVSGQDAYIPDLSALEYVLKKAISD